MLFDSGKVEHNILKSVDAVMINENGHLFLIEFKNRDIFSDKIKDNVTIKALSNLFMLFDMLYEVKRSKDWTLKYIELDDPIKFVREHVDYIVVCSREKNLKHYRAMNGAVKAKEKYVPPTLRKMNDYIFHSAYAFTESQFENEFVKKFKY